MNNIGFWSVFWSGVVANVLRRKEYLVRKGVKKLALTKNAGGGFDSEASLRLKVLI